MKKGFGFKIGWFLGCVAIEVLGNLVKKINESIESKEKVNSQNEEES